MENLDHHIHHGLLKSCKSDRDLLWKVNAQFSLFMIWRIAFAW
jgi:hypothetical protein